MEESWQAYSAVRKKQKQEPKGIQMLKWLHIKVKRKNHHLHPQILPGMLPKEIRGEYLGNKILVTLELHDYLKTAAMTI